MSLAKDNTYSTSALTDRETAWQGAVRRRVFVRTVLTVLIAGVLFTLLQPARYESTATVLMSAPTAIDEQVLEADVQGVAIQRRTLTGSEVTRQLLETLQTDYDVALTPLELRATLEVRPVPETNLLELVATGPEPELLPTLIDSWIAVYTDVRARDIESRKAQTLTKVGAELTGLSAQVEAAREALADYRREHDIISLERQENAVLAQLEGLNDALNRAVEEEVRAKAYLDTLRATLAAGEQVVPEDERSDVAAMAQSLAALRVQLQELRARYTEDYIRKAPQLREIPEQIAQLEADLSEAYSEGSQAELTNAERALRAARQSVAELKSRLQQQKSAVAEFNTLYARHEALAQDLARLEELNREAQARQVQISVSPVESFPQISVVDWPAGEAERIGPTYSLLLGGSALAALVAGIFAVWLYTYLHPRPTPGHIVTLSGLTLPPRDSGPALEQDAKSRDRLLEDRT
jgi:uncharacterized protein involved in exopolysaccharide biosynthesis